MSEIVRTSALLPLVSPSDPLVTVIARQVGDARHGVPAGIALVVDGAGVLVGTITDGDVRRALLHSPDLGTPASKLMQQNPITFPEGLAFRRILELLPRELERRGRRDQKFLGKIVTVDERGRPVRVLDYHKLWEQRVAVHRHVVVLGMGYVGLTLALELARDGFRVTGVDLNPEIVAELGAGRSHVHETGLPELLREQLENSRFTVTDRVPEEGEVFVIAVGTPVRHGADGSHRADLSHLLAAAESVGRSLGTGDLVALRSTVPVGTTREKVLPVLERVSGLQAGSDFHLAFAPERTVEGQALKELRSLPQIIGGLSSDCVEAAAALFRDLAPNMVRVESLEAAELVKLINNGFRDLAFAFANEIARMATPFNLDAVEVIRAANQGYPRNPVPLPSPGVGGPCLTKDPYILAAFGERIGQRRTLSAAGREVNESMYPLIAETLIERLAAVGKRPEDATVLFCGLAFKGHPETSDLRASAAAEIAALLSGRVGRLLGHDPVAAPEKYAALGLEPAELPAAFVLADAVLFLTNHESYLKLDVFAMARAMKTPAIVVDPWKLFSSASILSAAPSVYIGLGFVRSSEARGS